MSYELRDLQPYTEYIVELYGTNKHFTSDSFQVKVQTSMYGELYFWIHLMGVDGSHIQIEIQTGSKL